ncbi:Coenzyme Q-binding protein coq10a, mitochondrial [Lobosporangium transversale]|nr:Coenzyme Q-binding protein coq10a, mitochondrial [Lobosporangium transversale]
MLQTLFSRGYRHGKRSTIASIRTIALDIVVQKQPQQCRSFISLPKLPNLPNLLKPLTSSRQYKDRILVKYSQQEFYELVANVDDYQNFLPWCTYSKMSKPSPDNTVEPDPALSRHPGSGSETDLRSSVTVRHGELGIGFNSVQERYVSTVTCQEPWTVRAVSYDSKLFKELATTWRFTPNIPKASTLEATLDHELQERQLLTRLAEEEDNSARRTRRDTLPSESSSLSSSSISSVSASTAIPKQPEQHRRLTAASVFGASAIPKPKMLTENSPTSASSSISATGATPSAPESDLEIEDAGPTQQRPLPVPPKQTIKRISSPSNLAMMKPSDYPSCWVDFEIQFEFASPVHASMSSLFFDQVSKEMLKAFIKRAETLFGPR